MIAYGVVRRFAAFDQDCKCPCFGRALRDGVGVGLMLWNNILCSARA